MKFSSLLIISVFVMNSCIGDAFVTAKYSVKNNTSVPIQVKSKTSTYLDPVVKDTTILIYPKQEKIVYSTTLICPAGNCRGKIANDKIIDSVSYSFKDKPERTCKLGPASWKIKRQSAIAKISK